jgi:aminoglycoside 2'-N-acetyltransferase I
VIRTAHTYELDRETLAAARALLVAAFPGEITDDDWDHGLGGIHALAYADGELVGHASVVQRRFVYGGRALRPATSRASRSAPTRAGAATGPR